MYNIELCLDSVAYKSKPTGYEIGQISNQIAKNKTALKNPADVIEFAYNVSGNGYSFCPATLYNDSRKQDNFEQIQLLTLDFDGGITIIDVIERTGVYHLPIFLAYETLTSINQNKFRVLFLNDTSITDIRLANILLDALNIIFPEADKSCIDISKMFYGGKKLLYFDQTFPTINTESLLRNMSYYLYNRRGQSHYKKTIADFAQKHNIKLNKKGLLDISIIETATEELGTYPANGKNSPRAILFTVVCGEKLPTSPFNTASHYRINLGSGCTRDSVEEKRLKNHGEYRSSVLKGISAHCRLFRDFESGERKLHHAELFGISTNITHVETGIDVFIETLSRHQNLYGCSKEWGYYLKYNKEQGYNKMACVKFCPYCDTCRHGTNILSSIRPKLKMEKLPNFEEVFCPIETVQEEVKREVIKAINANDKMFHIIKAQTAIGKTETFLELMETLDLVFLIAVPTNKLKQDIYNRAVKKGLQVMKTPSLDEIKDKMPGSIWGHIVNLRSTGRHSQVNPFIWKVATEQNIECLKEFFEQKKELKNYGGHTITTHRNLLNMSEKTLKKYDVVIIDEDIIFSSIASNQCEIPIRLLKKIRKLASKNIAYSRLYQKITKVLKAVKSETLFRVSGYKWDGGIKNEEDVDGVLSLTDIPSFCQAENFLYHKSSRGKNQTEDSIIFLKPYSFKKIKYIMVSATVDKDICEYIFGKQNVIFYECKRARYKGTLNQYYGKSMSRTCIDNNPGILEKINNRSGFQYMITFKKYKIGGFYFGNSVGCDHLKGQNIDVVGTPYQVDFLYKLLPYTFGLNVNADAKMKLCICMHNGYIFNFTTFGDEHDVLRKFHFWMIESELEQAVGRARLLRCDCVVNLYSNFPIRQMIMKEAEY
jgi:hypothetical protein